MPAKHPSPQDIGRRLAQFRLARHLTQDEVGERLNIGSEAVSRLERGQVELSVAKLLQLAEIFECRADQLLLATSPRAQDQGQVIAELLKSLSDNDRQFALETMERLTAHLSRK